MEAIPETIIEPVAEPGEAASPLRLREVALAAVASTSRILGGDERQKPEELLLRQARERVEEHGSAHDGLLDILERPAPEDAPLVRLGSAIGLAPLEMLAVTLAAAVEDDLLVGRLLAHLQHPVGGSRPTLGLIDRAFNAAFEFRSNLLPILLSGQAVKTGLLTLADESAPAAERPIVVPAAICQALSGFDGRWAGATVGLGHELRIALPESFLTDAFRHARALKSRAHGGLIIRTGSPSEARSAAATLTYVLEKRPVFIESASNTSFEGFGPWLILRGLVPVICLELSPGERFRLPELPGYSGPILAICGPDGSVESPVEAAATWTLTVPPKEERERLWRIALGDNEIGESSTLAREFAKQFRHGVGRIAHLGSLSRHYAAVAERSRPERDDLLAAAWTGEAGGLDSLAESLPTKIPDDAFIVSSGLKADLDALLQRCRFRDELVEGLGVSATTRYHPGVRALFTGPSGTGKTLAAGWIATRLSLPLYRVDLASITSKYIGETEKNLSQLLARAEQAEVILLFDEADSLFGKRTDISDSNDRFANAQTNYLLQRIENYDGIVLLTSNSQGRFDPAFTRRLDFTIEFPMPGPEERRELWRSHLTPNVALTPGQLNELAVLLEFAGGHIRNAVLAAAVLARQDGRAITFSDLLSGAEGELRKRGQPLPTGLRTGEESWH